VFLHTRTFSGSIRAGSTYLPSHSLLRNRQRIVFTL
jgi:hypothetical protein